MDSTAVGSAIGGKSGRSSQGRLGSLCPGYTVPRWVAKPRSGGGTVNSDYNRQRLSFNAIRDADAIFRWSCPRSPGFGGEGLGVRAFGTRRLQDPHPQPLSRKAGRGEKETGGAGRPFSIAIPRQSLLITPCTVSYPLPLKPSNRRAR